MWKIKIYFVKTQILYFTPEKSLDLRKIDNVTCTNIFLLPQTSRSRWKLAFWLLIWHTVYMFTQVTFEKREKKTKHVFYACGFLVSIYKYMHMYTYILNVYIWVTCIPIAFGDQGGWWIPWNSSNRYCKSTYGFWEPNLGHLQDQQVFLYAEQCVQSCKRHFL